MEKIYSNEHIKSILRMHKIRQEDLSYALKLSQGQISRLLAGKYKKQDGAYKKLYEYVIMLKMKSAPANLCNNKDLIEAISSVWDGTPEQAKIISQVIKSLKPLCLN